MLKKLSIAAAGATIATLTAVSGASAATFGFSFSNENGTVNGLVEGILELPDGDGTFAATSVVVDSAPAALGYTLPVDILTDLPGALNIIDNTFTVVGGSIDASASSFAATNGTEGLALNFSGLSFLNIVGTANVSTGVTDFDSSTLTYSSVSTTVPEPGTILGLLAVGSLGALSRKRKA